MFQQTRQISRGVAARYELHASTLKQLSEAGDRIVERSLKILDGRVAGRDGGEIFLRPARCAYEQRATEKQDLFGRHALPPAILRPEWSSPAKNSGRLDSNIAYGSIQDSSLVCASPGPGWKLGPQIRGRSLRA